MLLDQQLTQQHTHPLLSRTIKFVESRLSRDSARALSAISAKYKVLNASVQQSESVDKKKKKQQTGLDGFNEPAMVLFDKSVLSDSWSFVKPIGKFVLSYYHRFWSNESWQYVLLKCCAAMLDIHSSACKLSRIWKTFVYL
jgi:hypothetical protein